MSLNNSIELHYEGNKDIEIDMCKNTIKEAVG